MSASIDDSGQQFIGGRRRRDGRLSRLVRRYPVMSARSPAPRKAWHDTVFTS